MVLDQLDHFINFNLDIIDHVVFYLLFFIETFVLNHRVLRSVGELFFVLYVLFLFILSKNLSVHSFDD